MLDETKLIVKLRGDKSLSEFFWCALAHLPDIDQSLSINYIAWRNSIYKWSWCIRQVPLTHFRLLISLIGRLKLDLGIYVIFEFQILTLAFSSNRQRRQSFWCYCTQQTLVLFLPSFFFCCTSSCVLWSVIVDLRPEHFQLGEDQTVTVGSLGGTGFWHGSLVRSGYCSRRKFCFTWPDQVCQQYYN